jgi:hypothetical protein
MASRMGEVCVSDEVYQKPNDHQSDGCADGVGGGGYQRPNGRPSDGGAGDQNRMDRGCKPLKI